MISIKNLIINLCFFILFSNQIFSQNYVICKKVIDGDTIELITGEKLRLIGVDTPEFHHPLKPTQYYTKESILFLKRIVEGKKIRIEFDEKKYDKYNRLLGYVYLENGTFVNAEIIKQGYGFVLDKFPFKYINEFKEYERIAKEKELGLWKSKGEFELQWIQKQGKKPIELYGMANNLWGIKYGKFIKPRISSENLISELEILRRWIDEYSNKDLTKKLFENGWLKEK